MRTSIYILFIVLLVAGCSPAKRIARLQYQGHLKLESDTIYVAGEPKDTTITVYMAGDTVVKEVLLFVEGEKIEMEPAEVETELVYAEAHAEDNKIILTVIQKEALFEHNLEDAIRRDTVRITEVQTEYVETIPKMFPFYKSGFFISLGRLVIFITLLILKKQ